MAVRDKSYSMISGLDEELLLTPTEKRKKDKTGVPKIFKSFIKNKEDTYE